MSRSLRFAIAGPGFIGEVHARAIAARDDAELVAVLGRTPESAQSFAERHGGIRTHASPESLLADRGVDAVVIATPNHLHRPLAVALLAAGRHVLVEKPLARTPQEGSEICEASRRSGAKLLVGHLWRFDREAQLLRGAVARGRLGEIVKTKGHAVHVRWGPRGWFRDPERAGGGALLDMGVHAIDTARYLIGDPVPVQVYASVETRYRDDPVDDTGFVLIRWSNGVTSSVECGWWHPHADGVEASTQLFGTEGYGRLFPTELRRIEGDEVIDETPELPAREEHMDRHVFENQIGELTAAVREDREPVPGGAHGLVVLEICAAAYRSARERVAVDLDSGAGVGPERGPSA